MVSGRTVEPSARVKSSGEVLAGAKGTAQRAARSTAFRITSSVSRVGSDGASWIRPPVSRLTHSSRSSFAMKTLINSVLRLVQFFLVLIATALLGNVRATTYNAAGSATVAINFSLFVCALSWIAVLYNLAAHFVSAVAVPVVSLALDGSASLFTFISAVVLSAKLTTANCANWVSRRREAAP